MIGFLSICTRHKTFGIFNNFPLSATPSYPIRYIFLEKDECFYPNVQGMKHSVSLIVLRYLRLPYALYGTFVWKKMIFHEIFQVGPCPNLKDSSLYERFSIHMYKA